ncbi:ATP-binding cassette domain-containing protein [Hymenobacter sp. HMF4947]|uniref:ATP-binding cassette domain-containing protein n=1 Tax=Hymenobacter ginkgonis TaxID=2682976 RepID=A0A7K1TIZ6_9BACT|nr:ATP-binding cassette domain-containing protein [Hymenobacter ginkgonis]
MKLVEVSTISFEERGITVLYPLSFNQLKGQRLALTGESGAGKSTLLQIIAGLVQPSTGEVRIAGSRVRGPAVALVPGHPGVAYLSQKSELPKFLRVEQVLHYASKRPVAESRSLYELCRIDHLLGRRTDQLSGGEQQRVALARLLLGAPGLLLLDEPFSNLDRVHKQILQHIIEELGQRLGITCLLVSHDATDTLSWADEIMVLHRGRIVQQASPEVVYRQPVDEYTAALFGDYNLVRGADRQVLAPTPRGSQQHDNDSLLVRPEQFLVSSDDKAGVGGTVLAIRFFGSYYELEIRLLENTVRVRALTCTLEPGDRAYLTVAAGGGWNMTGLPAQTVLAS